MRRAPRDPAPAKPWLFFLHNHREVIAAMDFFTVPTVAFNLLYCFFIISHDRRRILHFNITRHPTSSWIVQQLREAFPYRSSPRFLALNERHLKQLLADYVRYHHEDRTHRGLRKQTPGGRVRSAAQGRVVSHARLGGLHHRYDQAA